MHSNDSFIILKPMEYFIEEDDCLDQGKQGQEGNQQSNQRTLIKFNKVANLTVHQVRRVAVAFVVGLLALIIVFHYFSYTMPVAASPTVQLPKILWVYTRNELEGEEMFDQTMSNYYIDYGQKIGYEVRLVNSWTAYDWLSQGLTSNITRIMEQIKIDVGVDDLLILALLIEHGGVIMKNHDVIVLQDLKWIEQSFESESHSDRWGCSPHQATIFLTLQQQKIASIPTYSDSFIAATPQSRLLIQTFSLVSQLMTTTPSPNYQFLRMMEWVDNTEIYTAKNLLEDCINIIIERKKALQKQHQPPIPSDTVCSQIGLQTIELNSPITDAYSISEKGFLNYISRQSINQCKRYTKMFIEIKKEGMRNFLGTILRQQRHKDTIEKGSIIHRILDVKGNREVFLQNLPPRNVSICVITLDEVNQQQIKQATLALQQQESYSWTAVFFTNTLSSSDRFNQRNSTLLIKSTGNKGRNIEIAITQNCPHHSYALILNKGEVFRNRSALSQLSKIVSPRGVLGAYISLEVGQDILVPKTALGRFYRKEDGILNPKLNLLKNITNHLRLFSVEVYKFLPQFDLRDSYGNYYEDRIIFLMSFLDMIREEISSISALYVIKKYANKFNVPRKMVLAEGVILKASRVDEIDLEQMKRTFTRIETESMHINIQNLVFFKIPFDKMIVFNQGKPFIPFNKRQGEPVIPKIIHQAWLGTQMPPVKKYLYQKTAKIYSSYEMKLWKLENITLENFPITYNILKNIQEFNKHSPYNKFATMTDILRHEALYRFGGFWKDAAMNFLKPVFDDFRKYKLVIATDKTLRHRWLQGMCFYGNIKEYSPLYRITNFKNLNRMRIYNSDPMDIAGPVDFRQLITGDEQYDPQILILSYQTFYPAQLGQHPAGDLCTVRVKDEGEDRQFEVVEKEFGLLSNCSLIYPEAFGIQHNRYGVSWLFRKS